METIVLEKEKEEELLAKEENFFVDLKSSLIMPAKLSVTISAFANASGGDIFLGIKEDTRTRERRIDGFSSKEQYNNIVTTLESLEGLDGEYSLTYLVFHNNCIGLQITIFKCHHIVKATDGKIYIRRNAENLQVDTDEKKRRLELDKGIYPYENTNVPDSDIADAINSRVYENFANQVIPNIDKFNWLRTQRLCFGSSLNIAGVLLFTDEPQTTLPKKSSIKIYRYKTSGDGNRSNMDGTPLTIEGCAYEQIYNAVRKVKEIIESIKKLDKKFEDISYPDSALHEIITNAVLHRDYSITTDIQIRIYDNRVEIESPGKLAGHITVENILHEQFARNPKLVRLMNKFPSPPNKDVGEGLNTAFRAMEQLRLKQPKIEEKENSVLVIIRHEKLASPEDSVMEYLKTHNEITNAIGRVITGISSENVMKRVFLKLRDAGYIVKISGKGHGTRAAWTLKNKDYQEGICSTLDDIQLSFFDEEKK